MNNKDRYIQNIKNGIPQLIDLVESSCYNRISRNILYITTEINLNIQTSSIDERNYYKKENFKKVQMSFDDAINLIDKLYSDLYDVNLYMYIALKDYTIIEIRYLLKSSFDQDYYEKIKDYSPMLHVRLESPTYIFANSQKKFDVNWQHLKAMYFIRMLLWKLKYRIGLHTHKVSPPSSIPQ